MGQDEQIVLEEALRWLEVYSADPDPSVFDPPPPKGMMIRVEYAKRASEWEQIIVGVLGGEKSGPIQEGAATQLPHLEAGDLSPEKLRMSVEDRRNSGLNLLFLMAQAYYKILECVISTASLCCVLDLELNESYLWTITNLRNLLANHEDLRDFPGKFEPAFPDLYPSTIRDVDWEDMVAPKVEQFLSAVQRYVALKGANPLEESPSGWLFVELFRPSLNTAIERAIAYTERMRKHLRSAFGEGGADGTANQVPAKGGASQPRSQQSRESGLPRAEKTVGPQSSEADRFRLKYHSEIKRAILIQLTKQPEASDAEICRGLDADGAVELPEEWKTNPGDRRFFDAYSDRRTRHKTEVAISKVRRDLRKLGLLI